MINNTMPASTPLKANKKQKTFLQRLRLRPWYIRWTNWEFYPMWLTTIPHFFYWLYLSLKARSFLWFSATNPGIYTGGMTGESKNDIHAITPPDLMPYNIFVPKGTSFEALMAQIEAAGLAFPLIVKPDMGGRGVGVARMRDEQALADYHQKMQGIDYHVQELIDYPVEAGVMHYYFPDTGQSGILSVTLKEFLSIEGDGVSTFQELVEDNFRAVLVLDVLKKRYANRWQEVLPAGERIEVESIGNHCRGTAFLSGNHLIDAEMIAGFDAITKRIPGVYFCRYDLRCPSLEDLRKGTNIKILEINGVGADPAHIYDPKLSIWQKYRVIFKQWSIMYQIARQNHRKGIPYLTIKEAWQHYCHTNQVRGKIDI
jgi:hypothetical protein